jgi:heat shock protein hsp90
MKEMSATGGGGMFAMGGFPEIYHVVVNSNSALADAIMHAPDEAKKESLIKQAFDLARLSQGLLKGKELADFVKRNWEIRKLGN